jgi:hypothetical protein
MKSLSGFVKVNGVSGHALTPKGTGERQQTVKKQTFLKELAEEDKRFHPFWSW